MSTPVKLTYWDITRNIVRCAIDTTADIKISPFGKFEKSSMTHYHRSEWNMSATIACTSEIRIGDATAIIQWQENDTLAKTSGDLDIEIEKIREARR